MGKNPQNVIQVTDDGMFFQCRKLGLNFDGVINVWDLPYYTTMLEETRCLF
jgi:hypothetical protein